MRLPQQYRTATAVAQDLLGGPERISGAGGAYPEQVRAAQVHEFAGGGVGQVRRLHQGDPTLLRQLCQHWPQQMHFPDTRLLN